MARDGGSGFFAVAASRGASGDECRCAMGVVIIPCSGYGVLRARSTPGLLKAESFEWLEDEWFFQDLYFIRICIIRVNMCFFNPL